MITQPDEPKDLALAEELIFQPRGLNLARFSFRETLGGPTPDFRVLKDGEVVAFCEVKSPRDDWLDEQFEHALPEDLVGGARADPTFNKIARHVGKAAEQFDAVNADRRFPNVLVFVNHANMINPEDLLATLKGQLRTKDGKYIPDLTLLHLSEGRIRDAKMKIDLYIWIDPKERKSKCLLNDCSPHYETVLELFDLRH